MSDGGRLLGQVALVTGAGSGIGTATAVALARAGADVAINDLSAKAAQATADQVRALGRRAWCFPVDVSNADLVFTMVEQLCGDAGRLDVLVSSAVFSERESFLTAELAGFRRTLDVSLLGAYYVLRASAQQMVRQATGGRVVMVSSPHGAIAFPNCMAYNIAKAGLDMMMKTAATELLSRRVRINAIYPGWTDTPGERKFLSEDAIQEAAKGLPMGRLATPEEIAQGVLYLVGPDADYITGTILHIDGGLFLPWWSKRGQGDL